MGLRTRGTVEREKECQCLKEGGKERVVDDDGGRKTGTRLTLKRSVMSDS